MAARVGTAGRPRAVLIAGPTASGKSARALDLARRIGGVVVNADSMQVYRELSILTARPSPAEERAAPHRLYGHVPAARAYSVAEWLADAAAAIAAATAEGLVPIVVGGTGLYFKALTEGIAPVPAIPAAIRAHWRERAVEDGAAALHRLLAERDPAMAARLRPTDPQRIARALEVLEATGRSLADWQGEPPSPGPLAGAGVRRAVIAPERAELHRRIDARFDAMMAAGARDEARRIGLLSLDPALPAMRAIGVAALIAAGRDEMTTAAAVARAKAETRQYAKRQETWFRNQMPSWPRFRPGIDAAADLVSGAD